MRVLRLAIVFCIGAAAAGACPPQADRSEPTTGSEVPTCTAWADRLLIFPHALSAVRIPLGYSFMGSRYEELRATLDGYRASSHALVSVRQGSFSTPAYGDDEGIFWIVPAVTRLLHINLDEGIGFFVAGTLISSFLLGIAGFWLLFRRWSSRIFALIGLAALYFVGWKIGDLYVFYFFPAVSIIPLFLWLCRTSRHPAVMAIFLFLSGMLIGITEVVRGHAGVATVIFLGIVLSWGTRFPRRWKLVTLGSLVLGATIPLAAFHHAKAEADAFIAAHEPCFAIASSSHVFWHSVYIGLAFLTNPDVPANKDIVGIDKARSVDPMVIIYSPEYESILRREVFRLARTHPQFIITTLAAKAGVVLFDLLLFANVGLLAAFFYPKGWPLECAFWAAMAFDSLFGLLVVPIPNYLLGLMGFAVLYGIVSMGYAIDGGAIPWLTEILHHNDAPHLLTKNL
jgi:hypothetical protein